MARWGDGKYDDEGMLSPPAARGHVVRPIQHATQADFLLLVGRVNEHARALADAEEAVGELMTAIERVAGATSEALTLIKWTRLWLWGVVVLQLVELACLIRLAGGK